MKNNSLLSVVKHYKRIFSVLISACITYAILFYGKDDLIPEYHDFSIHSIEDIVNYLRTSEGISVLVFFCMCCYIVDYTYRRTVLKKSSYCFGLIAGIIDVLGKNYFFNNNLKYIFANEWINLLFSVIAIIGFSFLFTIAFEIVMSIMQFFWENPSNMLNVSLIKKQLFDVHPLLLCGAVIFVFWLPYLIAFLPGIIHYDTLTALNFYYGNATWTTHFPPLTVLISGITMDIGKSLGSDNLGCIIYIVPQFFLFLLTLAYNFVFFSKWRTPYCIRIFALLLFSLFPVFPMFAMMEVKDTNYYIVFLWIIYSLLHYSFTKKRRYIYLIIIFCCILCCIRNDGKYICLFAIVFILLTYIKRYSYWKIIVAITLGILLSVVVTNCFCHVFNIVPGSIREALSIPAQQTARYIRDHEEDIKEEEWAILNEIFNNHARDLGDIYEPNRSDRVKGQMIYEMSNSQLRNFFIVWFKLLCRHPECFISAAFNQSYGYYYIDKPEYYYYGFSTNNPTEEQVNYFGDIAVQDNPATENMRSHMKSYFYLWKELPLIKLLYHPATYVWALIVSLLFLHRKQKKKLFVLGFPLGVFLICCLSPLNGAFRYSLPIGLSSIIIFAFSVYNGNIQHDNTMAEI